MSHLWSATSGARPQRLRWTSLILARRIGPPRRAKRIAIGRKTKGPRFREGLLSAVQGFGHETLLPRGAAKAHDLHLGAVQRASGIREDDLSSSRAGERVSGSGLTRLLLPLIATFPTTSACNPAQTLVCPALQKPAYRCYLEPIRRTLPVGRDLLSATADGHSPKLQRPPKSLPRKRPTGLSPRIGLPHPPRRSLPGKSHSAELTSAYQPNATLTFSMTGATAVSDCGQLVRKLCAQRPLIRPENSQVL